MSLAAFLSSLLFVSLSFLHLAHGDCPSPPRLDYGELTEASLAVTAFPVGTNLTYQCRPGYVGTSGKTVSITCLPTDAWSAITEFCERRDCGNPGEPINGHVHLSKIPGTDSPDTKFGATANFSCSEGYNLVGRNFRTCTDSGTWNNAVPTCDAVLCTSPPSITNGMHTDSEKTEFPYPTTVRYSCNDDTFTLLGNALLSCTQYGNWSEPPPTCTVISCPDVSVTNAKKISGIGSGPFKYKHSITFECNEGFTMKGEAVVTCSENSEWRPAPPECVLAIITTASTTTVTKPKDTATTVQTTKDHITEKEATTVQTTKDHITEKEATTVQTTKDHITEKEAVTVQTTKDHITEKEDGSSGPNGGSNQVHNVGSTMLIVTILIMKWLMPYCS